MKKWLSLLLSVLLLAISMPITVADDDAQEDDEYVWALFLTNILDAEDGMGTYRYTLSLPTVDSLNEGDPRMAALATVVRRIVELDGSLGDPSDADILLDIEATENLDYATGYALFVRDSVLYLYEDGELIINEPLHKKYRGIYISRNKRDQPAIRYTRADGTTALTPLNSDFILLLTGEFEQVSISNTLSKEPIILGAGCYIEEFTVNTDIILHNSGLVESSTYSPAGIWMVGIAIDEDGDPILVDSGMWSTGPRPARGTWCTVCNTEIQKGEKELHLVHVCEAWDCQYGGLWASCATEGDLMPEVHAADPNCPYAWCASCGIQKCLFCQRDSEKD